MQLLHTGVMGLICITLVSEIPEMCSSESPFKNAHDDDQKELQGFNLTIHVCLLPIDTLR